MKKIICLFSAALLFAGCSLDSRDRADILANDYLNTNAGIESLHAKMYSDLKPLVTEVNMTEWGTDLYTVTRTAQANDYQRYTITPETDGVEKYYTNCYNLINDANCMLKYGKNNKRYAAEAIFLRSLGYFYLIQQYGAVPYIDTYIETANKNYPRTPLKQLYDQVIADLQGIASSDALPEKDDNHVGVASKQAVHALLAKLCLTAGWDLETTLTSAEKGTYTITGTSYFQQAVNYAKQAIDGIPLTMSFADKWSPKHEDNAEEIFAVQYERNGYPGDVLNGGHTRQNNYGSNYGDPTVTGLKASSGVLVPSTKGLYLWDKGDERYEGTFMTTIYNYSGNWPNTGYYAPYWASKSALDNMVIAGLYLPWWCTSADAEAYIAAHPKQFVQGSCPNKCHVMVMSDPVVNYDFKFDGTIESRTTSSYANHLINANAPTPCVKKFDDPNTVQLNSVSNDYRNIIVFHVSDLYLVEAEAQLMAGDEAGALATINLVRQRAGASRLSSFSDYQPNYSLTQAFGSVRPIDLILDERARELWAETVRWADLRRTRQLVRYNVEFNSNITSVADMSDVRGNIKWYRPIPAAEIETNTGISNEDQNPGY